MTNYRFLFLPTRPILALLLGLILLSLSTSVFAQDDAPASAGEVTINQVNEVARELWCPLCSGVRLDVCELKACDQMREEIALKLEEGQSTEQIKRYFVTQYGPQVLGEPPREGFNLLAWILPVLIIFGGGVFVFLGVRRMLANRRGMGDEEGDAPSPPPSAAGMTYAEQLDEELSRYD